MPRNPERYVYINVAIPTDSHIIEQLERDSTQTGIPKNHLVLLYLKEYIRLFIDGEIQRVMPSSSVAPGQTKAVLDLPVVITSEVTDTDLDEAFGI